MRRTCLRTPSVRFADATESAHIRTDQPEAVTEQARVEHLNLCDEDPT